MSVAKMVQKGKRASKRRKAGINKAPTGISKPANTRQ
jgi:hypothetical protein